MSDTPPIELRIGSDELAQALAYSGEILQLITPKAHPPGQPLSMLLPTSSAGGLALSGRSLGSKRRADGRFDVRVRLVNLSRADKHVLGLLL